MSDRKLLTVIVPVFNEAGNVEPLYRRLTAVMAQIADRYDFELLFTDNHSQDETFAILSGLAEEDPRVRVLRFSRNFGFQRSIMTGYLKARGEAAMQIDCDLQDPPELLLDFVEQWEQGHKVVYGVRKSRPESRLMHWSRRLFYRLLALLSEDDLPLDAGDFRLVDRLVLDELRQHRDQQPYLRGAIAAMGFAQKGIPYDRDARHAGESKFGFGDLIALGLDGILNHSVVPLRLATYAGLFFSAVSFAGLIGYFIGRLLLGQDWPAGFATTTILLLFSLSLNALFLGIIGEYLGRIYKQVKPRPLTIVECELGAGPQPPGS